MSSPVLVGLTAGVARPAEVDQHEHAPVDCPLLWRSGRDLPLAEQAVTGGSAGRRDPGGRRRPSPRLTLAPWRAVTRSGISGSEQIGVTDKLPAALGQVASGAAFAAPRGRVGSRALRLPMQKGDGCRRRRSELFHCARQPQRRLDRRFASNALAHRLASPCCDAQTTTSDVRTRRPDREGRAAECECWCRWPCRLRRACRQSRRS